MIIFEDTTSALYFSNDGRLHLTEETALDDAYRTFVIRRPDSTGRGEIVFATRDRVKADAYIAGYDLAQSEYARPAADRG